MDLLNLLKVYIENQIGPADCTALGAAFEQIVKNNLTKLIEVDNLIFSMKLVEEIRNASSKSGTQLLRLRRIICHGSLDHEWLSEGHLFKESHRSVSSCLSGVGS